MANDLTIEAVRLAMGMQRLRAETASLNIASANTPGAQAKRLDFGSTQGLLEMAASFQSGDLSALQVSLEQARKQPLASESFDAAGTGTNLDEEVADMATASVDFQALSESLNRHMGLMRLAITGRN